MALLSTAIASPRMLYQGRPASTIIDDSPFAPTGSVSGSGATLPTGTYYLAYSYVNDVGLESSLSAVSSQAVTLGDILTFDTGFSAPNGCSFYNYYIGDTPYYLYKQFASQSTSRDFSAPINKTGVAMHDSLITVNMTAGAATIPIGVYHIQCALVKGNVEGPPTSTKYFAPIDILTKKIDLVLAEAVPAGYTLNVYMGTYGHTPTLQTTIAAGETTLSLTAYTTTGKFPLNDNPTFVGQALYTAPAANANVTAPSATAYITELNVVNSYGSGVRLNLYIVPSGNTGQVENKFISTDLLIEAGDTYSIAGLKLAMPPGSSIYASKSYNALLALHISGVEVQ
jgi:hypothetical protein